MTGLRMSVRAALVQVVHNRPGVTRAAAARELGIPSGLAAETVGRLVESRLICEQSAPPTGTRGRPTTSLHPHPGGPLVAVAAIAHETWHVAVAQVGGTTVAAASRPHQRQQETVLAQIAAELDAMSRRYGERIQAAAIAVPGTVSGSRLVHAPNLGWHDVDLSALWPRYGQGGSFRAGNDATFAAVAESRRGAGAGAGAMVYLHLDAGIGGAIVEGGRVVLGATGAAGEFGHMPFGDPGLPCRCGARGCWNTSVDGVALARALGQPVPPDEVSYVRRVLAAARAAEPGPVAAIAAAARSLGRGAAGLVNALDPHVVAVGGLGREFLDVAGEDARAAYRDGLMAFRTAPAPPLVPAGLGPDAPLLGAAQEAFARVLTDEGLQSWASRR
jgi:predicted NBD/HSP70 family sugar kinase